MNEETSAALLAALVALRDEAGKRLEAAQSAVTAANALPKGTRGKRDAITAADATRTAALGVWNEMRAKIREAMRSKVKAVVEASLATLDHRDSDPVLSKIVSARRDKRRQVAITWEGRYWGVHARVSFDRFGLPEYIELGMLATPDEHLAQVTRWIERATTEDAKADAKVFLDAPDAHPLAHFGSSVTVSRGHGDHRNTYGVNGSTFSTHDDGEAQRLRILHDVAWHLRFVLNAADLPKVEDLEEILDGNG